MDFIKSRWTSTSGNNVQVNQSQAIETSYNTVTFTNAAGPRNPIIISTQHPSQISIINEVRDPHMKASEMTSPNESFHSVVSNFHNDNRNGKVNMAYTGSSSEMNNDQRLQSQSQSQHPQNYVYIQRGWLWHWPWSNWNQREKIFLLVIVILSLCILSLTSVLSVVLQKNIEMKNLIFEHLKINV